MLLVAMMLVFRGEGSVEGMDGGTVKAEEEGANENHWEPLDQPVEETCNEGHLKIPQRSLATAPTAKKLSRVVTIALGPAAKNTTAAMTNAA
jgi:hypothetical protein